MTGAWAQSRHNECTTPVAPDTKSDARFVPACDYQDRFTEPPHRATEVKQQGQGPGSPILVPGNVTDRPTPGHTTTEATHPAPVAQWIEQAPSKRLAAGSSPAGGAQSPPSFGRAFFLFRASAAVRRRAPDPPWVTAGKVRRHPAVTSFLRVRVAHMWRRFRKAACLGASSARRSPVRQKPMEDPRDDGAHRTGSGSRHHRSDGIRAPVDCLTFRHATTPDSRGAPVRPAHAPVRQSCAERGHTHIAGF